MIIKNLNQKVNLIRLKINLYFLHEEGELEQMFEEEQPKKTKPIDQDDLSVKERPRRLSLVNSAIATFSPSS